MAKGDILDHGRLEEVFKQYKPSAVMHFAAYADVGESVAEPLEYYRNNVAGTINLLEVMRDLNVSDDLLQHLRNLWDSA
jgi:UDP-glucose 4-epimerase